MYTTTSGTCTQMLVSSFGAATTTYAATDAVDDDVRRGGK